MHSSFTDHELQSYLNRIGLAQAPEANLEGLKTLHHQQFFSIPFENFDILLGKGISLEPNDVFNKLVTKRRGGYCFELNSLLLRGMRTLGFVARPLLARVHLHERPSGKTHQLNLVEIGADQWVVDAGFGAGGPRLPILLRPGTTHSGPGSYELARIEPWGWMLRTLDGDCWKDSYSFSRHHVIDADIELGNHYTSTSPACHFTREAVASLPTTGGRISLRNLVVTEVEGSSTTSRTLSPNDFTEAIEHRFGIELPRVPGILSR